MQKKILIICFDTPYPTNYGGVYDIVAKFDYYKKNNIKIDLICTCFDKKRVKEFKAFIAGNETIIDNYYIEYIKPNFLDLLIFLSSVPFSAAIRKINYQRIDFLKSSEYQLVLVEHLKSTYRIENLMKILNKNKIQVPIFLRIHNDEEEYYRNLFLVAKGLKRYFYGFESIKYQKYQNKILSKSSFDGFLFISTSEREKLKNKIGRGKENILLPVYTGMKISQNNPRSTDFLYVGNMDLDDNFLSIIKIREFLDRNDFTSYNLKIVGKCTSEKRKKDVSGIFSNIQNADFQFNVNSDELREVYKTSKFFLNFSSNASGVKTKLIEALSFGIPIISNREGAEGSNLEDVVLNDYEIDVQWLKKVLNNEILWSDYHLKYNQSVQKKIDQIEILYNQFFNSNFNQ